MTTATTDSNPLPDVPRSALAQGTCSVRSAFEAWITATPIEKDVARNSTDERKSAWPGQYRSHEVQLAWEAWCAALEATDCIAEYTGKENRRDWWSGGAWPFPVAVIVFRPRVSALANADGEPRRTSATNSP